MAKLPGMFPPIAARLVLVPYPRPRTAPRGVRRYRLARIDLRGRPAPQDRFGHLKRTYD